MTISSFENEKSYTADGTASETFPIPFPFQADLDLHVFLAGVKQTFSTNYSLTGAGGPSGGVLTWVGTPTASATVRVIRVTAPTQDTDYQAAGAFPAESHEDALDRAAMVSQSAILRSASSGDVYDAKSDRITNVADPTADQDAATKAFVQSQVSGTGTLPNPGVGATDQVLTATGTTTSAFKDRGLPAHVAGDRGKILAIIDGSANFASKSFTRSPSANMILNGDFEVAQRGTSFTAATTPANNDDTWLFDRWLLLSDGNDRSDLTQETTKADVPDGSRTCLKMDVEETGKKAGVCQIFEQRDAHKMFGGTSIGVSLSFQAKSHATNKIENIRAGILKWTGTADTVTSDVVDGTNWEAAGTNPTLATSWAFVNTPANLALTDSFQKFRIENVVANDATITNMAVFIWIDTTNTTLGDLVWLGQVQLEIGPIAYDWSPRTFGEELALCSRFYTKTFDATVAPAQATGSASGALAAMGASDGNFNFDWQFGVPMHKVPSITTYNPIDANANARNIPDSTHEPVTFASLIGTSGAEIRASTQDVNHASDRMKIHATADAEM